MRKISSKRYKWIDKHYEYDGVYFYLVDEYNNLCLGHIWGINDEIIVNLGRHFVYQGRGKFLKSHR